jgi:Fe-Mn family superoxide dismutase
MPYEMKPLSCNPGALTGLSEKIVVSHYENNYGGAVRRAPASSPTPGPRPMSMR